MKQHCFSVPLEGHRLFPNSFPEQLGKSWERVGKELGKSWEGADTSRAFREILGYFLDSL